MYFKPHRDWRRMLRAICRRRQTDRGLNRGPQPQSACFRPAHSFGPDATRNDRFFLMVAFWRYMVSASRMLSWPFTP